LEAGVIADGVRQASEEGTPQGSPLSPLLANVMLDDLDKELERRGHRFVRYADEIMVYVRSERAGQRVIDSITQFVESRLKLRLNRDTSAAAAVGEVDDDLAVEAAGAQQRRVEHLGAVGGGHDDHVGGRVEAVHLRRAAGSASARAPRASRCPRSRPRATGRSCPARR
jgi:hypothetical protein